MPRRTIFLSPKVLFLAHPKNLLLHRTIWTAHQRYATWWHWFWLWLTREKSSDITIDKVNSENAILYQVKVNNTKIEALSDTGASISLMSQQFFSKLENKPKLIKCNRTITEAGRGTLIPVECFDQLQIENKIFRDRVICHRKPNKRLYFRSSLAYSQPIWYTLLKK